MDLTGWVADLQGRHVFNHGDYLRTDTPPAPQIPIPTDVLPEGTTKPTNRLYRLARSVDGGVCTDSIG